MVRSIVLAATAFLLPCAAQAAEPTVDTDAIAEKSEIRAKGKRMIIGAWVCTGAVLSLTTASTVTWYTTEHAEATLALAGSGIALAAVAIPLAIAGSRRITRPERFMKRRYATVAPSISRRHVGATFSLRF